MDREAAPTRGNGGESGVNADQDRCPIRRVPSIERGHCADLAHRHLVEQVEVRCRPRTIASRRWLVQELVLPELGKLTIDEVERKHTAALHYRHGDTPYQVNQILEVVRKMFKPAEAWACVPPVGTRAASYRSTKYKEKRQERFLIDEEFQRLGRVLADVGAHATAGAGAHLRFLSIGSWLCSTLPSGPASHSSALALR